MSNIPKALTIAGSDSGGGAGIQADIKTFSALGVYGCSVITAITAQNTREVTTVHNVPLDVITAQIDAVFSDIGADAVKIGMLSNADIIKTIAESLRKHHAENIILDPVMISASGARLLEESAIDALKKCLMPMALAVTPNIPEAEVLAGFQIKTQRDVERAGKKILDFRCDSVVMKGGHLTNGMDIVIDIFLTKNKSISIENKRINKEGHGTGCTLSSAIASFLARGLPLEDAVKRAIEYTHSALEHGFRVGSMNYVLRHFFNK